MQRVHLVALFVCVLACSTAGAGVMYTYSGGQDPVGGSGINGMMFQFTRAAFVVPQPWIPPYNQPQVLPSQFTSYSYPHSNFLGIAFFTNSVPGNAEGIVFEEPFTLYFVYFPQGSLANYGTYSQVFFGQGTLTLSPATVPEPSSLMLLASGALGLLGAARGRGKGRS